MQDTSTTRRRRLAVAFPQLARCAGRRPAASRTDRGRRAARPAPAARCGSAGRTRSAPRSHTAAGARPGPAPRVPRAAASRAAPGWPAAPGSGWGRGTCPPGLDTRTRARAVAISGPGLVHALGRPGLRGIGAASIRDRAELELGDLPDRVDLVDRQQVGRCLAEVERDEAVARASRCETRVASSIVPRRELTWTISPSARPSSAASSGCRYTSAPGRIASSAYDRRVIEPVCQCSQQPAGVEHERVLVVGQLLGRQPLGRHEMGKAVVGVEPLAEHDHGPVAVLGIGVRVELAGRPEIVVAEVLVAAASPRRSRRRSPAATE